MLVQGLSPAAQQVAYLRLSESLHAHKRILTLQLGKLSDDDVEGVLDLRVENREENGESRPTCNDRKWIRCVLHGHLSGDNVCCSVARKRALLAFIRFLKHSYISLRKRTSRIVGLELGVCLAGGFTASGIIW